MRNGAESLNRVDGNCTYDRETEIPRFQGQTVPIKDGVMKGHVCVILDTLPGRLIG